jgi:hypothetical protein
MCEIKLIPARRLSLRYSNCLMIFIIPEILHHS